MKHRSKWEAVRLLEALRRMEEDAQKKASKKDLGSILLNSSLTTMLRKCADH